MRSNGIANSVFFSNSGRAFLLSILTFGIVAIFWQVRKTEILNAWLGRKEFSWKKWLILSPLTFGVYAAYTEFQMGKAVIEIQRKIGRKSFQELPWVCLVLVFFSGNLITNIVLQENINDFYTRIVPRWDGWF